jgi:hypothetical protein
MAEWIEHPDELEGFEVVATDGRVGTVLAANAEHILLAMGELHRKHVVPARAVDTIDRDRREVVLNRTKRQVKRIPQPASSRGSLGGWFTGSYDFGGLPPVLPGPPAADE